MDALMLRGSHGKEPVLKRSSAVLVALFILLAASLGGARSTRVLASSHLGAGAKATSCKKGYKLVNGVCKKVKKAKPKPTATSTPCTALACAPPSKFWKWTVYVVISGFRGTTSYMITGTACGQPQTATWSVQYTYAFDNNGDVNTKTYYDDGNTTLRLPLNSYVTFPLATDSDYPNPDLLKIQLRYDLKGHAGLGTFADEVAPKVSVLAPYKVKGRPAAGSAIPISDCASG